MTRDTELRGEILRLVEEYHRERFGNRGFHPATDTVHYAGRVFDADELVKLIDSSLDFFLTAGDRVAAIPRTTRIEEGA